MPRSARVPNLIVDDKSTTKRRHAALTKYIFLKYRRTLVEPSQAEQSTGSGSASQPHHFQVGSRRSDDVSLTVIHGVNPLSTADQTTVFGVVLMFCPAASSLFDFLMLPTGHTLR